MEQLEFLSNILQKGNAVFFGGAGVSTESGIPDFRSTDGLYNQEYQFPPETILSHHFFMEQPEEFYRFYRNKMLYLSAKPNTAHLALAALEKAGKLNAVITQNIDGLHQAAGSKTVIELHGSIHRNHCIQCGKAYGLDAVIQSKTNVPHCPCGGVIKPDVVLYEEPLNEADLSAAVSHIGNADTLIIGGTSLSVYPAAGLIRYFRGSNLILINKTPTPADKAATLVIHDSLCTVFSQLTL